MAVINTGLTDEEIQILDDVYGYRPARPCREYNRTPYLGLESFGFIVIDAKISIDKIIGVQTNFTPAPAEDFNALVKYYKSLGPRHPFCPKFPSILLTLLTPWDSSAVDAADGNNILRPARVINNSDDVEALRSIKSESSNDAYHWCNVVGVALIYSRDNKVVTDAEIARIMYYINRY